MFYTQKEKNNIAARQDAMFETILDYVDRSLMSMRNEITDIIFATAIAGKITPKKVADSYSIEKLQGFAETLYDEVQRRIVEEKKKASKLIEKKMKESGVCNVYDKKACGQKCK